MTILHGNKPDDMLGTNMEESVTSMKGINTNIIDSASDVTGMNNDHSTAIEGKENNVIAATGCVDNYENHLDPYIDATLSGVLDRVHFETSMIG